MKGINFRISQSNVLWLLVIISVVGCGGGKSGGNNLGITGYTFEDVVGAMGETAKINDRYIATWPGFEILPGGGTRRMNLQMPATVDGFTVAPVARIIDVNASGQFLAELHLSNSPEYSEVAALLTEGEPIILPYPPGHTQRRPDQMQANTVVATSINNSGQALVYYGGLEPGNYLVSRSSIERADHLGVLAANGMIFGNSPDGPPQEVPTRLVNGVPVPLFDPVEGQFPVLSAVSDIGTAVGTLNTDPADYSHPASIWIWTEAEGARFIPIEQRWNRVVPTDVNNQGVVIGWYDLEDPAQPGAKPFVIVGRQFIAVESLRVAPEGTYLGPGMSINNDNTITQSANGLKLGRPTP